MAGPTTLKVKDHSVSGEAFTLQYNNILKCYETFPKPQENKIKSYYNSSDYISHTNSKRNAFEKLYHLFRRYALIRKLNTINTYDSDNKKKLLDFGAGTGHFLKKAQDADWDVIGIEQDESARSLANTLTGGVVLESKLCSDLPSNTFSVITLWHVLEHLHDPSVYFKRFHELLVKDGCLIIAVPNYKSHDAEHYKTFWAAYDVPRHLWHFSRSSFNYLADKHSFKLIKTKPMLFDSFYVSLLSEKYKSGKMRILPALCTGLLSNLKAIWTKEHSSIIYILKKV